MSKLPSSLHFFYKGKQERKPFINDTTLQMEIPRDVKRLDNFTDYGNLEKEFISLRKLAQNLRNAYLDFMNQKTRK